MYIEVFRSFKSITVNQLYTIYLFQKNIKYLFSIQNNILFSGQIKASLRLFLCFCLTHYSCSRWKTNLSNCGASKYLFFGPSQKCLVGSEDNRKSHVSYRNLFQTAALTSVYGTFLLPICPLPAPSFSLVRPFFDDDGKPNAALLYGHKYFIMNFSLPLSLFLFLLRRIWKRFCLCQK